MMTSDADSLATQALRRAIRVHDLSQARAFYGGLLGCREASPDIREIREDRGLSFDFFGACLAVQLAEAPSDAAPEAALDVCLSLPQWRNLAQRLMASGLRFEVPPHCQHEGHADEHWTMFFRDPSGTALAISAREPVTPRWH